MSRRIAPLALAFAITVPWGEAHADGPLPAAVAQALFEQAREEMGDGDFAAAYPKLVESQRLDPSSGTLLNLVLCEEALNKIASAWLHARELADKLPDSDDRRPIVEGQLARLSRRVARISVRLATSAPADSEVSLDGVPLGAASLGTYVPIDAGVHRIVVTAAGRTPRERPIAIDEGRQLEWVAEPGPPSSDPRAPTTARASLPRWVGWTAVGVGAGALATGGLLGALALQRQGVVQADCPGKVCQDSGGLQAAQEGKQFLLGAVIATAAGAAGLGAGAYLLFHDARTGAPTHPGAAPQGAAVTYAGTF